MLMEDAIMVQVEEPMCFYFLIDKAKTGCNEIK